MATRRWTRFAAWRGKRIRGKVCLGLLAWLGAGLFARAELPVVAVHDSELTRALETAPAGAGTPAGTGFQWWPTTWHYFVMPESVKETLRSDGTAYAVVSDAQIAAGNLIDSNGYPVYPIVISLASEAISDSEVGALTNYVAAGGFLMVGSSAFTRHPDGSTRGDFAFANQLGLHMTTGGLTNWTTNATLSKVIAHRLVSHLPGGMLVWGMPSSADEIPNGTSPAHTQPGSHAIWQVTPADAQVIAVGDASPYLLAKPYGKGMFIYDAAMQPLLGHGGFAPGMYAYGILRKAIEWAFESASVPVPKLSPWPYAYDAAFMIRHDLGNSQIDISNIVNSAQFEATYGAKGDYFFATGTLWQEMSNSPAIIGSLQQAVSNYFATLGPQNGGLSNPVNASLTITNFDYWGWGPDEALDLSGNHQTSLGLGGTYAYNSLSNAFTEIEGWLGPLTNGLRSSAVPYYNATRDGSYQLEEQLGVKITGEQKLGPFPSWVLSTSLQTPGKRYPFITLPTSDWYLSQWYYEGWHVADSIDAGHVDGSIQDLVDFYYGMGALINLDCHTLVTDAGSAGWLPRGYLTYSLLSGLHPRLWSANSASIYSWWMQRGNAQVTASCSTNGTQPSITLTIAGATDPGTAVEALLPGPAFYGVSVRTNGVAAATNAYRINGQAVKVLVGTSVTNAQISYTLAPIAQDDTYFTSANGTLDVPAAGIVANDRTGSGGGLIPSLQTGATFGKLVLTNNGGFSYTPVSNYVGVDSFTYRLSDGVTNSSSATVTLDVAPPGSLFFDDFTRQFNASPLAPWQPALGGWTITNGVLQGTGSTVGYADLYVNGNWTNYSVQARIQLPTGAWAGGLDGRLNPLTGSKYTANIYPETSPGGTRLILELLKFHLWTTLSGMTSTPLSVVGTNWHTLKLTFQGNRIRVYFDSLMMIDATDLGYDGEPPYLTGGVGAHLFGLGASFDDFNVMPLPLTPVATDDSFTVGANTLLTNAAPGILINDTPGLGTNLTALLVAGTKNGSLTLNGDGSFGYMPATNFVGTDTFTYQVNDGLTNSTVATVTITVLPGPPQANNQLFAAVVNTMLNVASPGVLTNDWSGDGYSMTAALLDPAIIGSASVNADGSFTYVPATNFTGFDSFTYLVNNGVTNSNPGTVFVDVVPPGTWFFDNFSRPTNLNTMLPWVVEAGNWSFTNGELLAATSTVGFADAYVPGNWTDFNVQGQVRFPATAWAGGLSGRLNPLTGAKYTANIFPESSPEDQSVLRIMKFHTWNTWTQLGQVPLPGVGTNWHTLKMRFHGNEIRAFYDGVQVAQVVDTGADGVPAYTNGGIGAFEYLLGAAFQNVSVSPWLADASYVAGANQQLSVPAPGPLTGDWADYGTNLTATLVAGPTNGSVTLNLDGSFVYRPATNFLGTDTFLYQVNNGAAVLGTLPVTLTVIPGLTITPDSFARNYGGTNPVLTGSITGLRNGDVITASYLTSAATNSPVGSYAILAVLNDPAGALTNYHVITNHGSLTVAQAVLSVQAANATRPYGMTNPMFTASITGFVNGENSSVVSGAPVLGTVADATTATGNYPITVSVGTLTATNYSFSLGNGTLTVTPVPLLISANNQGRPYGAANPILTASYLGFVNSDGPSALSGSPTLSTTATGNSPLGTYPITIGLGTLSNANYVFSFTNGALTVSAAVLTVAGNNLTRSYGAANPPLTVSYSGFANGENASVLTGSPQVSTVADTNSPVGTYPIAVALGTLSSSNYTFNVTNGTVSVTPVTLNVSADNQTRAYGAPNPVFTASCSGFVNGETTAVLSGSPALGTSATPASPPGQYPITIAQGSLSATNYVFSFTNGTLTVSAAVLTVAGDNLARSYGAANPPLTVSYSGFANGESASVLTGSPQVSTVADTNSPVGTYPIAVALGTLSSSNYTFNVTNGTLTVGAAVISVAGDNLARSYGAANPPLTVSYSGFANGESASVLTGSPQVSTVADTNSPVGTYPVAVALGTLNSSNYTFNVTNGTLTVGAAVISVAGDNLARSYGAANPPLTVSYSGFANGESASVLTGSPQVSTVADTNSPVGTYPIAVALGTLSSSNYTFNVTNGTLSVTPVTLNVSADNQTRAYGAPNPVFTASYSGFVNGETTAVLSGSPDLGTSATPASPAGQYPITIAEGSLSATNYTFSFSPGTLTVVMLGPTIVSLTGTQTGTVLIQWTSVTNVTYRVQCRANLTDASWVDLTPDVTATNSISSLGDNSSANAQRFYRVMVVH